MLLILKFLLACVLLYWAVALGRFIVGMTIAGLILLAGVIGFVFTAVFSRKRS